MKTSEIELTLGQIMDLEKRILGDGESPGIIDQDLTMVERFWLNEFMGQIRLIQGAVRNLRDDIVRRRGKPGPDGNITIKATEKVTVDFEGQPREALAYTEEFLRFQREYEELLNERVKVEISEKIFHLFPEGLLSKPGLGRIVDEQDF